MDKPYDFQQTADVTYGRGYVYSLTYHIVWCTKYRKQVLSDALAQEVKAYLQKTASDIGMDIPAMEIMPDHIHLLVSCKPQLRLSDAIKVLKGNTARWLFMEHPEIKRSLWGGHLWNPSYFVATVSDRSGEQIKKYIQTQKTRECQQGTQEHGDEDQIDLQRKDTQAQPNI